MTTSDKCPDGGGGGRGSQSPSNMPNFMDFIMGSTPNMPARPGDPHYVGQTEFDTRQGLMDFFNNDICGGEKSIHSSINDLGKESTLISTAQSDSNPAAQDILNLTKSNDANKSTDTTNAEDALNKAIKDLDKNYYNTPDRKDFQAALADVKSGKYWKAEEAVSAGENTLSNKATDVKNASTDLTDGLGDIKNKDDFKGLAEIAKGMHALSPNCPEHRPWSPQPPWGGQRGAPYQPGQPYPGGPEQPGGGGGWGPPPWMHHCPWGSHSGSGGWENGQPPIFNGPVLMSAESSTSNPAGTANASPTNGGQEVYYPSTYPTQYSFTVSNPTTANASGAPQVA